VIIVEGDDLVLLCGGKRKAFRIVPPQYHALKAVSHAPLAAYVLLHPTVDIAGAKSKEKIDEIRAYLERLVQAREGLGKYGFSPVSLQRQKDILDASSRFLEQALETDKIESSALVTFVRSMGPKVLANAQEAASLQLQAMHRQVLEWKSELTGAEWEQLHVIVMGSPLPRRGNLAMQYFTRLLELKTESNRLVYTESVFDEGRALNILGTHLLDTHIGEAFFDDPARMHRDLLADAAEAEIRRMDFSSAAK
jgi:hypothetical protein